MRKILKLNNVFCTNRMQKKRIEIPNKKKENTNSKFKKLKFLKQKKTK